TRPTPRPTPFPYTTLFRSPLEGAGSGFGQQLLRRRGQGREGQGRRPQQRSACHRRLSRAPRLRHGRPRGRRGGLSLLPTLILDGRLARAARFLFRVLVFTTYA